jgi:hypothetical protein
MRNVLWKIVVFYNFTKSFSYFLDVLPIAWPKRYKYNEKRNENARKRLKCGGGVTSNQYAPAPLTDQEAIIYEIRLFR